MLLWVFTFIVSFLVFGAIYLSFRYRNGYKWSHIVGFPGSGKTTLCVKLAQKHLKRGWTCYSNIEIPGCYLLDPDDLGKFWQSPKSVIFLDEIGLVWDNRDFKSFKHHSRDWAKKHRHHRHKVYSFSQAMDYDSKLRTVTDNLYMLINYFGWLSVAKQIKQIWVVVEPTSDSEGRIGQGVRISPFILAPFGARIYTFIPKWVKYFNSFETENLPHKEYKAIQYPANMPKRFIPKNLRDSEFVQFPDSPAAKGSKNRRRKNKDSFTQPYLINKNPSPPDPINQLQDLEQVEELIKGSETKELLSSSSVDLDIILKDL